jgi:TonB family protein
MDFVIYSTYLRKLEELQRFERRITTPPFYVMLMAAFAFHMLVFLVISLIPTPHVIEVPVKQLSIHFGGGEQIAARLDEQSQGEAMLSAIHSITSVPLQELAPGAGPTSQKPQKKHQPTATKSSSKREMVATPRSSQVAAGDNSQHKGGGSATAAHTQEVMARYEQTLSQWINRFKVYPEEAQRAQMQGRVLLRIRIDRSGYMKFIVIQQSSGYGLLDQAVIQAAQQANPLPVVPTDYPGGQLLEFIIPIRFALK